VRAERERKKEPERKKERAVGGQSVREAREGRGRAAMQTARVTESDYKHCRLLQTA
jgi:hypothetical protein